MRKRFSAILLIFGLMGGCQTADTNAPPPTRTAPAGTPARPGSPAALIGGQPLTWESLRPYMVEAGGGQAIAELVVGQLVERRLADRGLTVTQSMIDAERDAFVVSLSDDPNEAQRLVQELRLRRGLGASRFPQTLERNAGLRLLVQDQVQVTDQAVREAYELRYGRRFEARIITADSLAQAGELARRARSGESFTELATGHSTDISRAQGGLMPLISPLDPTFPQSVRTILSRMTPGQVSDPVTLERGFAVLKLERILEGSGPPLADVSNQLHASVRREVEQLLMQQLLRTMLREAEVIVMDAALRERWEYQRELLLGGAEG